MGDLAIRAEGISKKFNLNLEPHLSLKETMGKRWVRWQHGLDAMRQEVMAGQWPKNHLRGEKGTRDFWALKDVSFELRFGEVLGVIGNNGAGKSTLMKILSQVMAPTAGRAEIHGKVGALLEVGTGFNPELTGRENIYLYGSVLGMDPEAIGRRFDEIVEFADIAAFLEEPIKHYSSGMYSRLGFSVAVHLECDVLLVDEVLSVGDATFTAKCQQKMREVTRQGRAVIFVSHGMSAVSDMCDTALVMREGQIVFEGDTPDAILHYMEFVRQKVKVEQDNPVQLPLDESLPAQFKSVSVRGEDGEVRDEFARDDRILVVYEIIVREASPDYMVGMALQDEKNNTLVQSVDLDMMAQPLAVHGPGEYTLTIALPKSLFKTGRYFVTPNLTRRMHVFGEKHEHLVALSVEDPATATHRGGNGLVMPDVAWQLRPSPAAQKPAA